MYQIRCDSNVIIQIYVYIYIYIYIPQYNVHFLNSSTHTYKYLYTLDTLYLSNLSSGNLWVSLALMCHREATGWNASLDEWMKTPWKMGPQTFLANSLCFGISWKIVGVKGEVWGIFPGSETNSSHLKIDGWKSTFPFKQGLFSGASCYTLWLTKHSWLENPPFWLPGKMGGFSGIFYFACCYFTRVSIEIPNCFSSYTPWNEQLVKAPAKINVIRKGNKKVCQPVVQKIGKNSKVVLQSKTRPISSCFGGQSHGFLGGFLMRCHNDKTNNLSEQTGHV